MQHIRTARAKEDRELVGKFTSVLKKQAAAQCRRIAQYKAQKLTILNAAKGRVVKLRNSVDEALKKMKNVKATSKRELSKARRDMDRVRDRLVEELQRCITESETRKNSRAKTDSLFQGLAKLFRTS